MPLVSVLTVTVVFGSVVACAEFSVSVVPDSASSMMFELRVTSMPSMLTFASAAGTVMLAEFARPSELPLSSVNVAAFAVPVWVDATTSR